MRQKCEYFGFAKMRLENGRKLAAHFSNGNVNKKEEEEDEEMLYLCI